MRFGRGLDNRKLKAGDFEYQYTSREAVLRLGEHLRLNPVLSGVSEPYRYEREVEEFLRWSPHVRREAPALRIDDGGLFDPSPPTGGEADVVDALEEPPEPPRVDEAEAAEEGSRPTDGNGAGEGQPDPNLLDVEEVIALVAHLDDDGLDRLERLERSGRGRDAVFEAIAGARDYER